MATKLGRIVTYNESNSPMSQDHLTTLQLERLISTLAQSL